MYRYLGTIILIACCSNAASAGNTPFLGEITITSTTYCPKGFVQAAGQSLPVAQNQALYAIVGNQYGGDTSNFNLPKLKLIYDANGVTLLPCIATQGIFPQHP